MAKGRDRYCDECGARLLPEAVFCGECGAPIPQSSAEPKHEAESKRDSKRSSKRSSEHAAESERDRGSRNAGRASRNTDRTSRDRDTSREKTVALREEDLAQTEELPRKSSVADEQRSNRTSRKRSQRTREVEGESRRQRESRRRVKRDPQVTGAMKPIVERPGHVLTQDDRRRQKRRGAILGVIILLFVAAGIAGGILYYKTEAETRAETERILEEHEREAQLAKEQAEAAAKEEAAQQKLNATHNVTFAISGMDYDQFATRIPVKVAGQTDAGETIDQLVFVSSDGTGVSVPAGSYSATVLGSPIASTGMLYTTSATPMEFKVSQDDGEEVSAGQAITLLPIEASKITQEMVDAAYSWAAQDEANASRAQENKAAAERTIVEWTERRRIEEEKRALREARNLRAQEFVSEYFTNVVLENQDDDSEVYEASNWKEILEAYVEPGSKADKAISKELSGYSATLSVSLEGSDDKTVTVKAQVASSKDAEKGWTSSGKEKTVVCTFNDEGLITDFTIK